MPPVRGQRVQVVQQHAPRGVRLSFHADETDRLARQLGDQYGAALAARCAQSGFPIGGTLPRDFAVEEGVRQQAAIGGLPTGAVDRCNERAVREGRGAQRKSAGGLHR